MATWSNKTKIKKYAQMGEDPDLTEKREIFSFIAAIQAIKLILFLQPFQYLFCWKVNKDSKNCKIKRQTDEVKKLENITD